jgi:aminomethyltransferase
MTGYEALHHSAAWLDVSSRGRIAALGEDRARLLHAMTSNHIQQLTPGQGCYVFFLNAQGRILGDASILCRPDHFLIDTEPEIREKLFQHLDKYIIADDVTLEDRTGDTFEIAVEGPKADAILAAIGAPLPDAEYAQLGWNELLVANLTLTGAPGFRFLGPSSAKDALLASLEAAGTVAGTPEEFRSTRLEHGKARYGEEITERYLPQETGQMHAVHFTKGCYIGQEIVERIRSRAQVHRHLMRVEIDAREPPPAGTKFTSDGKDAGEIVSAAFAPALQKTAAMAYMKTDFARPETQLLWGEHHAIVK